MYHLSDEQREDLRNKLPTAEDAAKTLLEQTVADSRPVDLALPIGRLTRIDAIQMQAMAQLNRHQLSLVLRKVEAALAAFDNGTYGLCRHCRGPIPVPRLEALPEAPFCLDCQERFEREP